MPARKLGSRAFLKHIGLQFDKTPKALNRSFINSYHPCEREGIQYTWTALQSGMATISALYRLPRNDKQASLLFSHDARRLASSLAWYGELAKRLQPRSVIEFGCGAGFLLRYLDHLTPNLRLAGIDREEKLVEITKRHIDGELLAGDYHDINPFGKFDLLVCDFGWDSHDMPQSNSPHSTSDIAGQPYCPGCSDDVVPFFQNLFHAWSSWTHETSRIAVVGRLADVGQIRACVLGAGRLGWRVVEDGFDILQARNVVGNLERFPAMVFARNASDEPFMALDDIARAYGK